MENVVKKNDNKKKCSKIIGTSPHNGKCSKICDQRIIQNTSDWKKWVDVRNEYNKFVVKIKRKKQYRCRKDNVRKWYKVSATNKNKSRCNFMGIKRISG